MSFRSSRTVVSKRPTTLCSLGCGRVRLDGWGVRGWGIGESGRSRGGLVVVGLRVPVRFLLLVLRDIVMCVMCVIGNFVV